MVVALLEAVVVALDVAVVLAVLLCVLLAELLAVVDAVVEPVVDAVDDPVDDGVLVCVLVTLVLPVLDALVVGVVEPVVVAVLLAVVDAVVNPSMQRRMYSPLSRSCCVGSGHFSSAAGSLYLFRGASDAWHPVERESRGLSLQAHVLRAAFEEAWAGIRPRTWPSVVPDADRPQPKHQHHQPTRRLPPRSSARGTPNALGPPQHSTLLARPCANHTLGLPPRHKSHPTPGFSARRTIGNDVTPRPGFDNPPERPMERVGVGGKEERWKMMKILNRGKF